MRALVTGAGGQLGQALLRIIPPGWQVTGLDRASLDITDAGAVSAAVLRTDAQVIVNAAAWTAVDAAEGDAVAAHAVNATGAGNLAAAAHARGARLVHVSTDYVFDGLSCRPYQPGDRTAPRSVYGASKAAGEHAVLAACPEALIVRSAWIYSATRRNFVRSILDQAQAGKPLRVVSDHTGSPTWAGSLADVLWALAARPDLQGILHFADAGCASWYDLAVAVVEEGLARKLLPSSVTVTPVGSAGYPVRAARPPYSVLDSSRTLELLDRPASHWREQLRRMLDGLRHG